MVVLLSNRKNKYEKEIIEILTGIGANFISDKIVCSGNTPITIISEYKKTELKIKKGIVVFLDNSDRFNEQVFPYNMIGICDESNKKALNIFNKNNIPVISCGLGYKNSITLSSINNEYLLITLQRIIVDFNGKEIEPSEFKIKLKKQYNHFSIMASISIMLLYGIIPKEL